MFDSQSQFYWRNGIADDGSEHRMCELEECSLFVESEPNNMFSFTVTDKDDKVLRSVFDFPSPEKAQESAERGWKSCLKPTPGLSTKGQSFTWRIVENGSASECRIGLGNSVLLQTYRDEESGKWSYYAYYKNALLLEVEDECDTNSEAREMLEEWYIENALTLLSIHSQGSD